MNKTMILAVLAAMLAPLAFAGHTPTGRCDSEGTPALGIVESPQLAGLHSGIYYVDDRNYALGNGIWIYEESNGIYVANDPAHSLQRGGSAEFVPDDNEICVDDASVLPDYLIL